MSEQEQVESYLMALATSDGLEVDVHFGQASRFDVYRIQNSSFTFLESRVVKPLCQHPGHNNARLEQAITVLSDCAVVVCAQIGPAAQNMVEGAGISCYELAAPLQQAIGQVVSYRQVELLLAEFQ